MIWCVLARSTKYIIYDNVLYNGIHSKKHLFREHNDLRRYRDVTSISSPSIIEEKSNIFSPEKQTI